jgi:hypothetical protein
MRHSRTNERPPVDRRDAHVDRETEQALRDARNGVDGDREVFIGDAKLFRIDPDEETAPFRVRERRQVASLDGPRRARSS